MKANRPIDAMIAEHVMGTEKYWAIRWGGSGYGDFPTYDKAVINALKIFGDRRGAIIPYWDEPCYSTDISAAWLVVEKLRERGWKIELFGRTDCWCVLFEQGPNHTLQTAIEDADTAPLAICLAALKAVGVEMEE
jgi:hypothetical protein